MAQYLEDWLEGEVAELSKLEVGELSNTFFFRDPMRPNYIDHKHFYSPADGTILYQKYVKDATDPIVEIKGVNDNDNFYVSDQGFGGYNVISLPYVSGSKYIPNHQTLLLLSSYKKLYISLSHTCTSVCVICSITRVRCE